MKKIAIFLIVGLAVLVFPKLAFGFGITPAEIYVEDLKPGGHYETEIYLTRPVSEANEALRVVLETNLGEMEKWFTFLPGKEFDFPSGKNTTAFKVSVDAPENVKLTNFKGQITAKGLSDKKASEGITIIKGAVLGVNIATSNVDKKELKVLSMSAPDVNSGDPVRLSINIKNLGNTAEAPDQVNLEIMDLFEKPLESLTDSTLEKVEPFATKEVLAEFNSNLEIGQYRIDAAVVFQDKEIARQKMVLTVNARPAKVEENPQQPVTDFVVNQSRQTGLLLAALGVFILAIISLLRLRKIKGSDLDFEKKLAKLIRENRLITWFLLGAGFVLIVVGAYFYLSPGVLFKTQPIVREPAGGVNDITPTVMPTNVSTKKESLPPTEVRGVSTEAEETTAPFVVSRSGTPGLYPIYSEPAFDSEIIYEAESGENFKVIKQSGDWYNVVLDYGNSGWLHKTSIKKNN